MPVELALDLVALALYDIVIYADDSTSMKYAENGSRIDDMKVVLERVTEVATLFDADGMKTFFALTYYCMHMILMYVHPTYCCNHQCRPSAHGFSICCKLPLVPLLDMTWEGTLVIVHLRRTC